MNNDKDISVNYDGVLIGGLRIGTNTLDAESHSYVRFDISTDKELTKKIQDLITKPINDEFTKKNGSDTIKGLSPMVKDYKGFTDVADFYEYLFRDAIERFENFGFEEGEIVEKYNEDYKQYIESEIKSSNKEVSNN